MREATKAVFEAWMTAWHAKDPDRIAALYHDDAVNWQVADTPAQGKGAIRDLLTAFFHAFPDTYTHIEHVMYDGEWAAWEWTGGGTFVHDLGDVKATGKRFEIHGCGFFRITAGKIVLQRGYWDKASWCNQISIPIDSAIR